MDWVDRTKTRSSCNINRAVIKAHAYAPENTQKRRQVCFLTGVMCLKLICVQPSSCSWIRTWLVFYSLLAQRSSPPRSCDAHIQWANLGHHTRHHAVTQTPLMHPDDEDACSHAPDGVHPLCRIPSTHTDKVNNNSSVGWLTNLWLPPQLNIDDSKQAKAWGQADVSSQLMKDVDIRILIRWLPVVSVGTDSASLQRGSSTSSSSLCLGCCTQTFLIFYSAQ